MTGQPLRVWPGVAAAVLLVLIRFVVPVVGSEVMPFAMLGALAAALVIFGWWLFFSRAPWSERLGGIALTIAAVFVTSRLVHPSIAGGGMGMLLYIWVIPAVAIALVVWAVGTRRLSTGPRRASMVASILLACGVWTLVRTDGVTSNVIGSDFHWRWTPTAEQRLLAQAAAETKPLPPPPAMEAPGKQPAARAGDTPSTPPSTAVATESTKTRSATTAPDTPATATVLPPPPPAAAAPNREARVARLSRSQSRRHRSRRAHQDRLDVFAAGPTVAAADRTGLVVVRRRRRSALHAGAAR